MSHYFDLETVDGRTVVTFAGPKILPEAQDSLYGLVESGHTHVVLDLRHVCVLTSRALALVFGLVKRLHEVGGRMRLCCVDPALRDMLHVTHLDGVLDITDTREDALRGF